MNNREGRRQFTFTLYENNSKDREIISFLDKISQSVRGKVIRGFVLEQFFNGTNSLDVKDEEKKKTEDLKKLEAKERVSSSAKKQIDDDIPNPFDNLNL